MVNNATNELSKPKKKVFEALLLNAGRVSRTVTTAERQINAVMKTAGRLKSIVFCYMIHTILTVQNECM
jgi:hypothetical protein